MPRSFQESSDNESSSSGRRTTPRSKWSESDNDIQESVNAGNRRSRSQRSLSSVHVRTTRRTNRSRSPLTGSESRQSHVSSERESAYSRHSSPKRHRHAVEKGSHRQRLSGSPSSTNLPREPPRRHSRSLSPSPERAMPVCKRVGRDNPVPSPTYVSPLEELLDTTSNRPTITVDEWALRRWKTLGSETLSSTDKLFTKFVLPEKQKAVFQVPQITTEHMGLLSRDRSDFENSLKAIQNDLIQASAATAAYYGAAAKRASRYKRKEAAHTKTKRRDGMVRFDAIAFTEHMDAVMKLLGSAFRRLSAKRANNAMYTLGRTARKKLPVREALSARGESSLLLGEASKALVDREYGRRERLDSRPKQLKPRRSFGGPRRITTGGYGSQFRSMNSFRARGTGRGSRRDAIQRSAQMQK